MAEAREQGLGILADALLKLVLHMQQQVFEAEDVDQKVRGVRAVHQLGRGYRQTVALQAKLGRDQTGCRGKEGRCEDASFRSRAAA